MCAQETPRYRGGDMISPSELPEVSENVTARKRYLQRLQQEWDSLLWIFSAFFVLYYCDVVSNALFNKQVDRLWLTLSVLSWFLAICCGVHVIIRRPRLDVNNWFTSASPTLAFLLGLFGVISFMVAMWSVWNYWTLAIVPILVMGFISGISVSNL